MSKNKSIPIPPSETVAALLETESPSLQVERIKELLARASIPTATMVLTYEPRTRGLILVMYDSSGKTLESVAGHAILDLARAELVKRDSQRPVETPSE